jgi:hypothetical protein
MNLWPFRLRIAVSAFNDFSNAACSLLRKLLPFKITTEGGFDSRLVSLELFVYLKILVIAAAGGHHLVCGAAYRCSPVDPIGPDSTHRDTDPERTISRLARSFQS